MLKNYSLKLFEVFALHCVGGHDTISVRFCGQVVNVREQQDALEFYNALFDSIDEGLKILGEPRICEKLFGGTFADQKICKDCPHRYQREETFTSISVDVRSHNNLLDSLKEYVKGDILNNDNAYLCEECNKKVGFLKMFVISKILLVDMTQC
ncbi:unnamed protein product [Gongylonema pulchrum]|uniref:USP domain-containing protein n=1 Tax=Gongylonema pulchrum TaxID=637853 RepID=A0A183EZW5_9BILA|nr:unnamed protein product [Gongylonema pulchrum]